jgi:hypothetical protein
LRPRGGEQAALAVPLAVHPGPRRLVARPPQQEGDAEFPADLGDRVLGAEVAVRGEQRIHVHRPEAVHHRLGVESAEEKSLVVQEVEVHEVDIVRLEPGFDLVLLGDGVVAVEQVGPAEDPARRQNQTHALADELGAEPPRV